MLEEKIKQAYDRWLAQPEMPADLAEELNSIAGDEDAITDRFYRELEFGTGGLRGVIGAGTNRMNVYNIRKATQGLANYLNASDLPKKVAIGYDSRIKSDVFAKETAAVLAANGIKAYIYPRLEPTPALSWAVRYYGCGAGVCVTASHNPAKYNGYKVYGADGCQITLEVAAKILAAIEAVDCFAVQPADFDAALAEGKIEYSSEECLDDFVDAVYAQRVGDGAGIADLKLVYTPLNGSGLECVKKLLKKLGVSHVTVVPEQEKPGRQFPHLPLPQPRDPGSHAEGSGAVRQSPSRPAAGNRPRLRPLRHGSAGRQGRVPAHHRQRDGHHPAGLHLPHPQGAGRPVPEHPVAVTTIVSTDMATPVAEKYGVELRRTLTGFKFIGEQIGKLEAEGRPERYIFGFEESYGYLSGGHVRDKDAVNATLLVCEAAAWYAQQGKTLLDAIEALYREFGYYRNALCSFAFEGESGMHTMQELMKKLRANAPEDIAGYKVESVVDYDTDGTGLPRANVLEYHLGGGHKLMVRPSGTEPKIKVYLSAVGDSEAAADAVNAALAKAAADMMKA